MANTASATQATPTNGAPPTSSTPNASSARELIALPESDGNALNAFASEAHFATAMRMATALSKSTLVPKEYMGNLPNIVIALSLAARIGADPLMVMQNLNIIHGKPSWSSTFLIASVNACKRFSPLRWRFEGSPGDDTWGARAVAKDKDSGEECVGPLVNIALSKAEGWFQKTGSKWKTLPELMIMYRSAAFWTRVYAPEVSLGMGTEYEAIDMVPDAGGTFHAVGASVETGDLRALEADLLGQAPPAKTAPAFSLADCEERAGELKELVMNDAKAGAEAIAQFTVEFGAAFPELVTELNTFAKRFGA